MDSKSFGTDKQCLNSNPDEYESFLPMFLHLRANYLLSLSLMKKSWTINLTINNELNSALQ